MSKRTATASPSRTPEYHRAWARWKRGKGPHPSTPRGLNPVEKMQRALFEVLDEVHAGNWLGYYGA